MKIVNYLIILTSLFFSTITFAMEGEEFDTLEFSHNSRAFVRFEKAEELNEMIRQYKLKGTPISLAVACGSKEMPLKIIDLFESKEPAKEQWIGLDLLLTDKDDRGGPHIRMDATNETHWKQVVQYLKDNEVEVDTVAFTAFGLHVNSDTLRKDIMPIVKKGGLLVYPAKFMINLHENESADCVYFGLQLTTLDGFCFRGPKCLNEFMASLEGYYINKNSGYFQNRQALEESIMAWSRMKEITGDDAERRLAAKVFSNRVTSFNRNYVDAVLKKRLLPKDANELFSKSPDEFSRDYIAFFREYMAEIGFDPTSYKIYSPSSQPIYKEGKNEQQINLAQLYGVDEYVYPQDGTFPLASNYGPISLVLIKQ